MPAQYVCDFGILEGLAFHNVAPMTGTVTNGKEYGLIFAQSAIKSIRSPGMPVNGVMGMLEKVRGFFLGEPVGMFPVVLSWHHHPL
jgi:hypothetical protein